MPDTFTTADGSKLGYRIAGDTGPFLVLCHALLATSEQWVDSAPRRGVGAPTF